MARRTRSIRVRMIAILAVPIVASVALWAFGSYITGQRGVELITLKSLFDKVIAPTSVVVANLQQERTLSANHLAREDLRVAAALHDQWKHTDSTLDLLQQLSNSARDEIPPQMAVLLDDLIKGVRGLGELRARVDGRGLPALESIQRYSALIEVGNQIYDRLMIAPDLEIIQQVRAIILLARSREIITQQSALITNVLAVKRMNAAERDAFLQMASKRQSLFDMGASLLDANRVGPYRELEKSPVYQAFVAIENDVLTRITPNETLPVGTAGWSATTERMSNALAAVNLDTRSKALGDVQAHALSVLAQVGIGVGAGLVAVLLSLILSIRFSRRLTAELVGLQRAALELADERLPSIVERLRRGHDVDVAAEAPTMALKTKTTEVDSVGAAFTTVRHTAIEAAVGQAELRKGVSKVFLSLARRSQSLLQRQLTMLDGLEQEVSDPDVLEKLFGVDHLTTRMRRHAEGLIILSGAAPARGWRQPVNLFDVIRAAIEEVEDYQRVDVLVPHGHALAGAAVTDMIHLLAELIENAAVYSPPHTRVQVRGEVVGRGFALEIEDRGLGIAPAELAQLNERLANPPEFDLADSDQLGLFVVGRLAQRHGIRVSLRPSPYGGTTAIALIPPELVVEQEALEISVERLLPPQPPTPAPAPAPALALTSPSDDANSANSLPKRVRQTSLAPQLREERTDLFSSFQAGWRRAQEEES